MSASAVFHPRCSAAGLEILRAISSVASSPDGEAAEGVDVGSDVRAGWPADAVAGAVADVDAATAGAGAGAGAAAVFDTAARADATEETEVVAAAAKGDAAEGFVGAGAAARWGAAPAVTGADAVAGADVAGRVEAWSMRSGVR